MTELFATTQDALVFAFNYSSEQYPRTPMSQIVNSGDVGNGKGLVSTSGAGQAGLILAALKQMDPVKMYCLVARYASHSSKCKCCGSERPADIWREAVDILSTWALQHVAGSLSYAVVRMAIVENYFRKGVSISDAARRVGVPEKTAYNQRAKIHAALREVDATAQREIADILEGRGVVGAETREASCAAQ